MTLYFENEHGEMHVIAELEKGKTDKECLDFASREIKKFCGERNFKIHYMRMWNTERYSQRMMQFDVGSHVEFFFLVPSINDLKRC